MNAETPEALPAGRFSGPTDFALGVRDALACAAREGWPELILSDATFEDWPLRERAVVDSLHAWSKAGRRMTLLATRFDEVVRQQPRFVAWRQTWGHLIDCRVCRDAAPGDCPSALWSRAWCMQRFDSQRSVGIWGHNPERSVLLRQLLDEKVRYSTPGFPATTLGL